jgi:hypothetical protein
MRFTFSALAAHLKKAALLGIVHHETGDLRLADPVVESEPSPEWARGGRRV